jgi:hypothetical protein
MKPEIDLDNKTAEEIDNLKVEKEKELQAAQNSLAVIEQEELEIGKQIINLQGRRKDLQIAASKAKQIVRTLTLDIRILTSKFWSVKNGGR